MLAERAALAIPLIVRNIHENVGPIARELAHLIREDRFITNEGADAVVTNVEWPPRGSPAKLAHLARQLLGEKEKLSEGDVLAKRNQMDFVVARHPRPGGGDQRRRVIKRRRLLVWIVGRAQAAGDHVRVGAPCDLADRVSEIR